MSGTRRGALCGLLAAATFGASAPLCKLLLPEAPPAMLAALLYAGAAGALALFSAVRRGHAAVEAPLALRDRSVVLGLGAIVLLGGVAGPVLMLVGLGRSSAVAGALLLNLEGPFTAAVAVLGFREHLGRRAALATALVVGGAVVLTAGGGTVATSWGGAAAIAGACLCWAVDNNLTQRLSLRDPVALVRVKAAGAAAGNFVLALALGHRLPPARIGGSALIVGAVSYGASVVLDAYALRLLGAVRESAYFATAPFVGAIVGALLFRQGLGPRELAAGALMAAGVTALLRERHAHVHTHEAVEHEHLHVHDEHHQHPHAGPVTEPHSHQHKHEPLTHEHPHVPDLHHRHGH